MDPTQRAKRMMKRIWDHIFKISLQSMVDLIWEREIENIYKFGLCQPEQFLLQAIQIMISIHQIRQLQRNLITKFIARISSKAPLKLWFLIEEHPFSAYHLQQSELFLDSEPEGIKSEMLSITPTIPKYLFPMFLPLQSPEILDWSHVRLYVILQLLQHLHLYEVLQVRYDGPQKREKRTAFRVPHFISPRDSSGCFYLTSCKIGWKSPNCWSITEQMSICRIRITGVPYTSQQWIIILKFANCWSSSKNRNRKKCKKREKEKEKRKRKKEDILNIRMNF